MRGGAFTNDTGDTTNLGDGVQVTAHPGFGTSRLNLSSSGSAFLYLDGAIVPVVTPAGFTPADAFAMHHVTTCFVAGDVMNIAIAGLLDQTFNGPFGTAPPFFTDTPLTGMTAAKCAALLGAYALLSMTTTVDGSSEVVEQSNQVYDADFTFNLNGTYTIVASTSISPSSGPVAGGTAVRIAGAGLNATTGVTFDGLAATSVVIVSDSLVTAVTPSHAVGAVSVVVTGTSVTTSFTYELQKNLLPPIPVNAPVVYL